MILLNLDASIAISIRKLVFYIYLFMASCTNEASDSFISETFEVGKGQH